MNVHEALKMCQRQDWQCILCNKPLLDAKRRLKEAVDVEHVFPQWVGGSAKSVAHRRCNKAKGFKLPTQDQMLRYIKCHAPAEIRRYYEKRGLL